MEPGAERGARGGREKGEGVLPLRPVCPGPRPLQGSGRRGHSGGSTHTLLLVTRAPNQPFQ